MSEYGEPWTCQWMNTYTGLGDDQKEIDFGDGSLATYVPPRPANRIVACVNALQGMNPEALKGVVEALDHAMAEFLVADLFDEKDVAGIMKEIRIALRALHHTKANENQSQQP